MEQKPLILITNDDGITAPGIRHLIKIMNEIGEVVVVAPDSPQSGMGHAITMTSTLYCDLVHIDEGKQTEYSCNGTPADCVKIAKHEILKRMPDLCVSGINHGANSSINTIYSGTMSAAIEAGIEGIPAIGFSLLDYDWKANFHQSEKYVKSIALNVLQNKLPKGVVLNVNIPNLKEEEIKGVKVCRQAKARWIEKFDKRTNPQGRDYYWLTGEFICEDAGTDTDIWALENGYISIVPTKFDLTSYRTIDELKQWKFNEN
jgi:5'/3'-nucleotidase surE